MRKSGKKKTDYAWLHPGLQFGHNLIYRPADRLRKRLVHPHLHRLDAQHHHLAVEFADQEG